MVDRVDSLLGPLARALLESVSEGVVVFDTGGAVAYANAAGRDVISGLAAEGESAERVVPKLARVGGRIAPVWVGGSKICEVVYVPPLGDGPLPTLAEQERRAILDTLDATGWRLTESAQRLGISRTTLWRRLRAYGLDRDNRVRWARSS